MQAKTTAGELIDAIVKQTKRDGKFTLLGSGTFKVAKGIKAHKGLNLRTESAAIKVKAGKTVVVQGVADVEEGAVWMRLP